MKHQQNYINKKLFKIVSNVRWDNYYFHWKIAYIQGIIYLYIYIKNNEKKLLKNPISENFRNSRNFLESKTHNSPNNIVLPFRLIKNQTNIDKLFSDILHLTLHFKSFSFENLKLLIIEKISKKRIFFFRNAMEKIKNMGNI